MSSLKEKLGMGALKGVIAEKVAKYLIRGCLSLCNDLGSLDCWIGMKEGSGL